MVAAAAAAVAVVLLAGAAAAVDGPPAPETGGEVQMDLVRIAADPEFLLLDSIVSLPETAGAPRLPARQGTLGVSVMCALPHWVVAASLLELAGPDGAVPLERLLVASESTGGVFLPLVGEVIVGEGGIGESGDLRLAVRAAPDWKDATGAYRGLLRLRVLGMTQEALEGRPSSDGGAPLPGVALNIGVEFAVQGLTLVVTSVSECSVQAGPGPGMRRVEPEIGFLVATNEDDWEVRIEGTPFESEDSEIALERILWTLVGSDGEPGEWTSLGDSNVVLRGFRERGIFVRGLRLALETTMADEAGAYRCSIRLAGAQR